MCMIESTKGKHDQLFLTVSIYVLRYAEKFSRILLKIIQILQSSEYD